MMLFMANSSLQPPNLIDSRFGCKAYPDRLYRLYTQAENQSSWVAEDWNLPSLVNFFKLKLAQSKGQIT
jgi:hypothetical protein